MSILVLILISDQNIFLNNFKELRNHYLRIGKIYNIPITVVGYMGGSNTTFYDDNTGILHLDCSDNEIGAKLMYAADFIKKNMDYDFVIKTNASTIVNIQLMYRLMLDPWVMWDRIYNKSGMMSIEIGYDDSMWFDCPCGTYAICTRDVFNTLFDDIDKVNASINELADYYLASGVNIYDKRWGWYGISEDSLYGWLAKKHDIQFYSLWDDLVVADNYREHDLKKLIDIPIEDISITPSIICKTGEWPNVDERNNVEPTIIHVIGMLFESVKLTNEQYCKFYKTNMIENAQNGKWSYYNVGLFMKN